jgi:hypothetical protein
LAAVVLANIAANGLLVKRHVCGLRGDVVGLISDLVCTYTTVYMPTRVDRGVIIDTSSKSSAMSFARTARRRASNIRSCQTFLGRPLLIVLKMALKITSARLLRLRMFCGWPFERLMIRVAASPLSCKPQTSGLHSRHSLSRYLFLPTAHHYMRCLRNKLMSLHHTGKLTING